MVSDTGILADAGYVPANILAGRQTGTAADTDGHRRDLLPPLYVSICLVGGVPHDMIWMAFEDRDTGRK